MKNGQVINIGYKKGKVIRYNVERKAYLIELENGIRQYVNVELIEKLFK
jgi:hypothetical protein